LRVAAGFEALARVAVDFFAVDAERLAVERDEVDFFAREPLERLVVLAAACGAPSSVHLPERTR
jgi:hypothetical protein